MTTWRKQEASWSNCTSSYNSWKTVGDCDKTSDDLWRSLHGYAASHEDLYTSNVPQVSCVRSPEFVLQIRRLIQRQMTGVLQIWQVYYGSGIQYSDRNQRGNWPWTFYRVNTSFILQVIYPQLEVYLIHTAGDILQIRSFTQQQNCLPGCLISSEICCIHKVWHVWPLTEHGV